MEQFTIPQFIDHKPKIVGPLTFPQFIFIGIATATSLLLIFYLKIPIFLSVSIVILIMSGGAALAFGKVKDRPLLEVLKNLLTFSVSPKIYLWKRKIGPPPKFDEKTKMEKPNLAGRTPVPAIVGKSRLKTLFNQIETKTK